MTPSVARAGPARAITNIKEMVVKECIMKIRGAERLSNRQVIDPLEGFNLSRLHGELEKTRVADVLPALIIIACHLFQLCWFWNAGKRRSAACIEDRMREKISAPPSSVHACLKGASSLVSANVTHCA